MRISDQASGIELRPLRYQFPVASGEPWDDNWLVIGGDVTAPAARWSFADPCLLVGEARELTAWLRAVAVGAGQEPTPVLSFVEPVLAFSHGPWRDGTGVLRVHLSLEAAPPQGPGRSPYVVEIETGRDALLRAAEEWDQSLGPLPER